MEEGEQETIQVEGEEEQVEETEELAVFVIATRITDFRFQGRQISTFMEHSMIIVMVTVLTVSVTTSRQNPNLTCKKQLC